MTLASVAVRYRPPRPAAVVIALALGLWLEFHHLPGWGLALFVAIVLAASAD